MDKFLAEFLGTLILVLFGCGAAVLGGVDHIGQTGIALSFGFAIVALAYGLGPISGGHVNPAVSLGAYLAGLLPLRQMLLYWVAQVAGALAGAAILALIAGSTENLGQNGWGAGYNGEFTLASAAVFEVVMTALFVLVILGATHARAPAGFGGLAIGLTLAAIHLVGIQVTGVSVNPARSLGPALLAGGQALSQLWLFIAAPLVGGALAALPFRMALRDVATPPVADPVEPSRA